MVGVGEVVPRLYLIIRPGLQHAPCMRILLPAYPLHAPSPDHSSTPPNSDTSPTRTSSPRSKSCAFPPAACPESGVQDPASDRPA
ncbi:hypothetical protein AB1N83_007854 [Pleurotus pulmonarius]